MTTKNTLADAVKRNVNHDIVHGLGMMIMGVIFFSADCVSMPRGLLFLDSYTMYHSMFVEHYLKECEPEGTL